MKHINPIETRSAVPIETRDDDGTDDPLVAATEAVEELRTSVADFQSRTEETIETRLGEITGRLDEIETRSQRPGGSGENTDEAAELEQRAFTGLIRHGREALGADEVRALQVADDTAGGYLAPDQFIAELQRNLVEFSPVRQAARVGAASSSSVILPKRTGTITASWVGETETRPETEPTYGQVEIPIHEAACYVDVSNKMLEDAVLDIAAELAMDFAEEFGRLEGVAFVNGDGLKKPRGFMVHGDVGSVNNGHASALQSDGIIDLVHSLPAAYRQRGSFMMNSTTIGSVRKLKDSNGQYLWAEPLSEGNPPTLLGRPVIDAPDMPDIAANAFPIAFGDFGSGYRIYDRVMLSVLRDPYSQATSGLTRFHARRRVGGDVVKGEALKKLKIAT